MLHLKKHSFAAEFLMKISYSFLAEACEHLFWLRGCGFLQLNFNSPFFGGGEGGEVKILPQFSISYPLRLTTSVVFVPSHRDVHHHFVYPQPPFESRISKAEGGVSEV